MATSDIIINIIIGGLINGGIYALISMGLSIQYGVAHILNVSHGEFIMAGAIFTVLLTAATGMHPLLALVIVSPFVLLLGFVLHRTVYKKLGDVSANQGAFIGNAILVSFGLMFIIQNLAMAQWGAAEMGYSFMAFGVNVFGVTIAANRLFVLLFAVIICAIFYIFLMKSRPGKAIRAAAQDPVSASMMGIKINVILALCFGIGAVLAASAGALLSMINPISVTMGLHYTVVAIIVVVLGGLGSVSGSMLGGFIIGIVGSIVSYIETSLVIVAYYAIILLMLLIRPKGLLGR